VTELLGKNITLRDPPQSDLRTMIRYTSLAGALHEFRCRTWFVSAQPDWWTFTDRKKGLLDIISRIEKNVDQTDELRVLIQRDESEFVLIDPHFCQMNDVRWHKLTTSNPPITSVFLRLIRVPKSQRFNVVYAQRIFNHDTNLFLQMLTAESMITKQRKKLGEASRGAKPLKEIKRLEKSLQEWRTKLQKARNNRVRNRFWLLAVRYYLLDPKGLLFDEDEIYQEAVRQRSTVDQAKAYTKLAMSLVKRSSSGPTESNESNDRNIRGTTSPMMGKTAGSILKNHSGNSTPGPKDAAVIREVIEKLQAPTLKRPNVNFADLEQPSQIPEVVEERIKPPARAMTSQSQMNFRPPEPASILRSRTIGISNSNPNAGVSDLRKPRRRISFATNLASDDKLPTHVKHPDIELIDLSDPVVAKEITPPYIFRSQGYTSKDFRPAPLPMSALRLPPGPRQRPGKIAFEAPKAPSKTVPQQPSQNLGPAAARLQSNREKKAMKLLQPFFEWRTAVPTTPTTPRTSDQTQLGFEGERRNGSVDTNNSGNHRDQTLDILHAMLNAYETTEEDTAIQRSEYDGAESKSIDDVVRSLEMQFGPHQQQPLDQKFWDNKINILLSVDTILSCFIGSVRHSDKIVQKIWGIVYQICQASVEDVSREPCYRT
jgi:hypothetical protein